MATVYYDIARNSAGFLFGDMLSAQHVLPDTSSYRIASPYGPGEFARRVPELAGSFPAAATTALEGNAIVSICGWARCTALTSTQHILKNGYSGGATSAIRIVFDSTALHIGGRSQSGDTFQNVIAASSLSNSTWYFFAAVYDYANDNIYTKVGSGTLTATGVTFGASTLASGLTALRIGGRPEANDQALNGFVYGVMAWNAAKDNTFFESLRTANIGVPTTTVGANTASFTLDLKTFAGGAAASETGIDVVVLDAATGAACTRVLHVIPGESADGSGQMPVSLPNSLLNNGDIVLVGLTNTNGTPGVAAKQHFYPVQVTV